MLNVSPNTYEAGIWMAGGAPSVDSGGHMYVITGNGRFDGANTSGPTDDYGDSFLQLAPGAGQNGLGVSSFFTPSDQAHLNANDLDFGSGGSALVLNLTGTPSASSPQHLVVGGGKDGALYVLNGDQMGGSGDANAWQRISLNAPIFATASFWNNTLYVAPVGASMLAYSFDPSAKKFGTTAASQSGNPFGFPGASASVSASDASSNGIVWAIDSQNYCTPFSGGCGPAVLHAYLATNLAIELWNSATVGTDAAGSAVKFTRADDRQRTRGASARAATPAMSLARPRSPGTGGLRAEAQLRARVLGLWHGRPGGQRFGRHQPRPLLNWSSQRRIADRLGALRSRCAQSPAGAGRGFEFVVGEAGAWRQILPTLQPCVHAVHAGARDWILLSG